MADDEEESWQEFFENNRLVPVHPNRRKSGSASKPSIPFRLVLKSVVGIPVPRSLVSSLFNVYKYIYHAHVKTCEGHH